ncbi:retrovirus-related pol polyprotein from transposon TNT 1-94 [Tanacetum coccineum]
MTTPTTTTNNSQMHNNIMAAGSKDRPPMLATGRYAQWQSCFLRYVDTKPNKKELRLCILEGPYVMTEITVPTKPTTNTKEAVPEYNVLETYKNTTPKKHAYFNAEAEAIHMILSVIRDDIYSIVDACTTVKEMWVAIKRLQQGESLNKQDVKTNIFMTVVKQTVDLDKESYHKLFDILKQYQNEVNEICAKKIAKNVNPLALVATTQCKELLITLDFVDTTHVIQIAINQAHQNTSRRNLFPQSFAKISNKNHDTSPRNMNDNQTRQFEYQRAVIVAGARETICNQVVQQTGIQCFNCKGFGHMDKECRTPKRVKDYAYHKEKMMLCKQEEKGVPLTTDHGDWLDDTDEEPNE